MTCPRCGSSMSAGAGFCQDCGWSPDAASAAGTSTTPLPAAPQSRPDFHHEPGNRGTIHVGDLAITVEGDLVPVASVQLGTAQSVYFEQHILLWKQPAVAISIRGRKGMSRRFFAGMPIFLNEARGP